MALRKIVLQGDECLTKVCRPVTEFNQRLHTLIDDMKETLLDSGGVGLAAPQVGVLRRVCVVMNEDEDIIELVNPEIDRRRGGADGSGGLPQHPRQVRHRHPPLYGACPGAGPGRQFFRGGGRGADRPLLLP